MTARFSNYDQVPHLPISTTLTASGTPVAAPSAGQRIMLDYLSYWLVDPAGSNTVTLTLGTVTLPPVGLSSSRGSFTMGAATLGTASAISVVLAGSGSVGFYGSYLVAE